MNHLHLLIIISQLFLSVINTGENDRVALRRSVTDSDDQVTVLHKMNRVKKQNLGYPTDPQTGPTIPASNPSTMICDKKVDRPADPADCFQALDYLYDADPPLQTGCAVVGTCAIMPLTKKPFQPVEMGKNPFLSRENMTALYDKLFSLYCDHYTRPASVIVNVEAPGNIMTAGFLLGPNLGGAQPTECNLVSATLTDAVFEYSTTPYDEL